MRPWLKRTLIGIVGVTALFGTVAACSHHAHDRWQAMSDEDAAKFKARMIERVGRKLDLDEAQKTRLATLADKLREQRLALLGETRDPRAELHSVIAGPTFDRGKALGLVQAKTQAVQTKGPEVITAAADFFDSLRPEQQDKLRTFMDRGRHGWHG
jgi:periplasmic protein CpxP/Spy